MCCLVHISSGKYNQPALLFSQLSEQILYPKGVGKSYLGYSEAYREKGEREKGMDYIDRAIGKQSSKSWTCRIILVNLVRKYAGIMRLKEEVVSDENATYFGAKLNDETLVPGTSAKLGKIWYDEWIRNPQNQR